MSSGRPCRGRLGASRALGEGKLPCRQSRTRAGLAAGMEEEEALDLARCTCAEDGKRPWTPGARASRPLVTGVWRWRAPGRCD